MDFSVSGEPAHTRCLDITFRQGEAGSIAFRGDLLDLRKAGFMELAGHLATAGIIHRMAITGSFMADSGEIREIDWEQTHVAHEANDATGGECCRDPMPRLSGLVGTQIGLGFLANLKHHFGGPLGCSHINTLFQETSAFAAGLSGDDDGWQRFASTRSPGHRIATRSVFLDGVSLASRDAVDLSVRVSDLKLSAVDAAGDEALGSHDETRLVATIELDAWRLRALRAAERCRVPDDFESAVWSERSDELEGFAGQSLTGGMARLVLERFGERRSDERLKSALLSLAPCMTQVPAALVEAPSLTGRAHQGTIAGPGPCYMLRGGGPLVASMTTPRGAPATD